MTNDSYARISVLRPHDGDTVDFEAGYIRHLEWHRQARDPWTWFGWTVWAGDRQRWFVYATFNRTSAELDSAVDPAGDERDNISNVTPHGAFLGSALYRYLPDASRGSGEPSATTRVELTTVDLHPGNEKSFEATLVEQQSSLRGETLWFRMIAGGPSPRYLRLRPRANFASLLDSIDEQTLPVTIAKATIEILSLRPAMCYGLKEKSS